MLPTDVLQTYLRLREAQRTVNLTLQRMLSKKAILQTARELGLFRDGLLLAQNEEELALLNDVAIYDYYPSGGKNAVARYAAQHRLEGDTAVAVAAMCAAEFTLIELGEPTLGTGLLVYDLLADEDFFLADVALSESAQPGLILATRILRFDSFRMTTGAYLVFDRTVASIVARGLDVLLAPSTPPTARTRSSRARLLVQLGLAEPDDARTILADLAASKLPADHPDRVAYFQARDEQRRLSR